MVAVLEILSGFRNSRDLEAYAKPHREALNQTLGLNFKRWPSDADVTPFVGPVLMRDAG